MSSEGRDKFARLAIKRVNSAIKAIDLIGNLSNKSNYDYTDADVTKIFKALQGELNSCRKRFDMASKQVRKSGFTLD